MSLHNSEETVTTPRGRARAVRHRYPQRREERHQLVRARRVLDEWPVGWRDDDALATRGGGSRASSMSANARKERSVVCVARARVRVNKQTNKRDAHAPRSFHVSRRSVQADHHGDRRALHGLRAAAHRPVQHVRARHQRSVSPHVSAVRVVVGRGLTVFSSSFDALGSWFGRTAQRGQRR